MYGVNLLTGESGTLPEDQATYITACHTLIEARMCDDIIAQWLCEAVIGAITSQWAQDAHMEN